MVKLMNYSNWKKNAGFFVSFVPDKVAVTENSKKKL